MSIIRLKDNHSMRISLRYVSALEKRAKNGNGFEYLYTLQNGDGLYVSPQGHDEIKALRPQAGEPFILSKRVDDGVVTWEVARVAQEIEKAAPKAMAAARSISPASTVPIPPSLTTPESQRMFRQLVATIEAVKAAEEFAETICYPIKFAPEDIRAMAISNSIAAQGQSRRAA
jgi:hypothetical protein